MEGFTFGSVCFRLALAMMAGCAVGYGRAQKKRPAGLRTYMLTSTGAALAILTSFYAGRMLETGWAGAAAGVDIKYDVARLCAQVLSGIGFMGAGTIIAVEHNQTYGLTSAAGMFACVCMGLAAGAGFYPLVLSALFVVLLVLDLFEPLESLFKYRIRNLTIFVEFDEIAHLSAITQAIGERNAVIHDIDIEHTDLEGAGDCAAVFNLKLQRGTSAHSEMITTVAELACVTSVQELIS